MLSKTFSIEIWHLNRFMRPPSAADLKIDQKYQFVVPSMLRFYRSFLFQKIIFSVESWRSVWGASLSSWAYSCSKACLEFAFVHPFWPKDCDLNMDKQKYFLTIYPVCSKKLITIARFVRKLKKVITPESSRLVASWSTTMIPLKYRPSRFQNLQQMPYFTLQM